MSPQPVAGLNVAGSGRIAIAVNQYFQSAGVSPRCAATNYEIGRASCRERV